MISNGKLIEWLRGWQVPSVPQRDLILNIRSRGGEMSYFRLPAVIMYINTPERKGD